jgi:murein DD-endopeptidase MepM/ murein hydrolase activator NlpD/soluble lytic murein transglycosylase-like protein
MNRKGDAFLLILDILFLAAIVLIFAKLSVAFTQQNPSESIGTRQAALLHTYAMSEQMLLYVDEAAKFAAYESLATTMRDGLKMPVSKCPQYVTYTLWTSQGGGCMPQTDPASRTSTYGAFERAMQSNLCRYLRYPGFPGCITYDLTITPGNGISITGMARDRITLPIVAAKDATQQQISSVLLQENVAKAESDFRPDATIPVTVIDTTNRKPRTAKPSHILVVSGFASKEEAIQEYTYGSKSVHYLIDREGSIYQLVPEDQRSFSMPQCDVKDASAGQRCEIKDIEDKSISIALVNSGALGQPDQAGKCQDGRVALAKTGWCKGPCEGVDASKYTLRCWESYTQEQVIALEGLVIDIAFNNNLKPENILLEEHVQHASDSPGPALYKEIVGPVQPGTNLQSQWYSNLISDVTTAKAQRSQEDDEYEAAPTQSTQGIPFASSASVVLPVDPAVISSCFGSRTLSGSNEHFGIDFAIPVGTPVLAIADGIVQHACEDWVGECACSSRSASCPLKCKEVCRAAEGRPLSSRGYGNNVLIDHDGQFGSHYNHLKSVNVKPGETVKKGQVIGLSGNTGSSTGPHLHFTIFQGKVTSLAKQEADNPMCIFPDELLRTMRVVGSNCKKYSSVSHSDPVLAAECAGVQPLASVPDCSVNTLPLSAGGDATVDATVKRLESQQLMPVVAAAAKEYDVDEKLIMAIITQESAGKSDVISPTGCAGIGQFCYGTANSGGFKNIFGGGLQECKCPANRQSRGLDCTAVEAQCVNDPRLDPQKSIRATALHLQGDSASFKGKTDQALFAIAAYNAGPEVVRLAIAKTGKPDPQWPEVAAALDAQIIHQAYCVKSKSICSYFDTPDEQNRKVKEVRDYVSKVGAYYIALGGSLSSAFGDLECNNFNVREMGSYTFTPSFSTTVPDLLTAVERTTKWASDTYKECDGAGGKDNVACIDARMQEFNRDSADLEIVQCEDTTQEALLSLRETIADCQENRQDACTCSWTVPKLEEPITLRFRYDAGMDVSIPSEQDDIGDLPIAWLQEDMAIMRSISLEINDKAVMTVSDPDREDERKYGIVNLVFAKKDGKLIIQTKTPQLPACQEYKTTHRVCVQVKHPIPVLSQGTQLDTPELKFALWLNDSYPPEPVTNAMFQSYMGVAAFTFTASASEDVSYYNYTCSDGVQTRQEIIKGREDGKTWAGNQMLDCAGQPFMQGQQYTLTVTPVDLSANRGPAVTCKTNAAMDALGVPTATCTTQDTTGQTP